MSVLSSLRALVFAANPIHTAWLFHRSRPSEQIWLLTHSKGFYLQMPMSQSQPSFHLNSNPAYAQFRDYSYISKCFLKMRVYHQTNLHWIQFSSEQSKASCKINIRTKANSQQFSTIIIWDFICKVLFYSLDLFLLDLASKNCIQPAEMISPTFSEKEYLHLVVSTY